MRVLVCLGFAAGLVATCCYAADLTIVNESLDSVARIDAKPSGVEVTDNVNWLQQVLPPGQTAEVSVTTDENCTFDVTLHFSSGQSEVRYGLDVCQMDGLTIE